MKNHQVYQCDGCDAIYDTSGDCEQLPTHLLPDRWQEVRVSVSGKLSGAEIVESNAGLPSLHVCSACQPEEEYFFRDVGVLNYLARIARQAVLAEIKARVLKPVDPAVAARTEPLANPEEPASA
jgi:hypothetical protein